MVAHNVVTPPETFFLPPLQTGPPCTQAPTPNKSPAKSEPQKLAGSSLPLPGSLPTSEPQAHSHMRSSSPTSYFINPNTHWQDAPQQNWEPSMHLT